MTDTIDAVLPLTLRDIERAEFLLESLATNFKGLGRLWVVCPDAQVNDIRARLVAAAPTLDIEVMPELLLVPEFNIKVRQSGWFRQQMIKLAIHEHVRSALYLTLDADVVCTRPVSASDLLADGKGVCAVEINPDFRRWYQRAAEVLRLPLRFDGRMHNVTPALLHREGVAELRKTIESMIAAGRYSAGWRGIKQRWHLWTHRNVAEYASWRLFLMAARPWTEYALYYTHLEQRGLFARFHLETPQCIYDRDHSLWQASDQALPDEWNPGPAFAGNGPPWFMVVQSNTGIPFATIRERLQPLLKTDRH